MPLIKITPCSISIYYFHAELHLNASFERDHTSISVVVLHWCIYVSIPWVGLEFAVLWGKSARLSQVGLEEELPNIIIGRYYYRNCWKILEWSHTAITATTSISLHLALLPHMFHTHGAGKASVPGMSEYFPASYCCFTWLIQYSKRNI